jgi:hypothetical protein
MRDIKGIEGKVNEIKELLLESENNTISLINGSSSKLLFYSYYLKYIKQDYEVLNDLNKNLEFCIETIKESEYILPYYSYGLSGFIWTLHQLQKEGILDVENIFEFDSFFVQGLVKLFEDQVAKLNYDLFNGGIGLAMAIDLLNPSYNCREKLVGLNKQGKWQTNNEIMEKKYNFGLSHGIPSVISYLCNIHDHKILESVENALEFIRSFKRKSGTISLYPSFASISSQDLFYNSRLGWCYGDLGIAIAFWKAGKLFNRDDWKKEAIEIIVSTSKRRDLSENLVVDSGICHGTVGIAHIFNRFFKETEICEFEDAKWFWINETLEMARNRNGLAGYKAWQGNDIGWTNEYGLLEGIAGIGLVLIGFLSNELESLNWDRALLIS